MPKQAKKNNIFHRRLDFDFPLIAHGKGIYLYDEKGKKYLDAVGGALVANLGHGVREIAEAIKKLAQKISYLHGSQFSTSRMEDYARELCRLTSTKLNRVFFVSGGSEAVESAIKLARQYHYDSGNPKKSQLICRKPAYHGSTILTLSISSKESHRAPYLPLLLNFPSIPAPFCYHCPFNKSYPQCHLKCAWELERVIKKEGQDRVFAFIAEPVIGASAGAVVPPPEYFPIIRRICDKYNVLLILDEVMCGFGRTGKYFAFQHWSIEPDIVAISKGIGGGFVPLAAVFCQEKIYQAIKKGSGNFVHGFTFENNPLTCGVGFAVLQYLKKRGLVKRSAQMGRYLLSRLRTLSEIGIVGDVRGLGLMAAVELVRDRKTRKPFPRSKHLAEKIVQLALKKGLNLYFALGFTKKGEGDAIMVAPPFIVSRKEIDKIVEILKEVILETWKNI